MYIYIYLYIDIDIDIYIYIYIYIYIFWPPLASPGSERPRKVSMKERRNGVECCRIRRERERSLLTTYWSEST